MFLNKDDTKRIEDLKKLKFMAETVLNLTNIIDTVDEACRWWVHPINTNRSEQGDFENLVTEILEYDHDKFFEYTRMEVKQFQYLLNLVKPYLTNYSNRKGLPEALSLFVTLRFLATGDSHRSLSFAYHIEKSKIQQIIPEVCDVLWNVLSKIYFTPKTTNCWMEYEADFYDIWNFPHCLGAIDGKHINVQVPKKLDSVYNYKEHYSIVLLGIADANYKFSYVDIGAFGSQSDEGVFTDSILGLRLQNNEMNLPYPAPLPGCEDINIPYYFLGDKAFPLKQYLLKPFSGKYLEDKKYYFNKTLFRALRVVENAFGILAARWKIYDRTIIAQPNTVDSIIKATVVLHNMLCENSRHTYAPPTFVDRQSENNEIWINGTWRNEIANSQLNSIPPTLRFGPMKFTTTASSNRDYIKEWIYNRK